MRIAFINATHRWGGVKTWTLGLAGRLVARGHGVHLFLRRGDPFAAAARREGLGVDEMVFGPDWNPLAVMRLKRRLRELGSEIVVTNVSKDNRIGGPAAKGLGLPVLQHVGGPGDITDNVRMRWEQRRYVTRVVVPARSVRDALLAFPWMEAATRVTVIPNSVDLERFRPGPGAGQLRGILGIPAAVPLLVTTGQLTSIKGHDVLLAAFAELERNDPVLALVGRGPEEARLRALTRSLGLEDRVHFLGFREDVHVLLEDADVVVQPSLQEGLPISVLEFMAKGKAMVVSDLAGTPEAISHGVEGLLVPPGDRPALRDALRRLLEDGGLRLRLGEAARDRAEREFGLDRMADRVEGILAGLIEAGRGRGR
jgi:glycosyltransferase involved in cell wall biosynthesis